MLPGWWFDDVFPHHFQVLNYLYLGVASMSRTPKNQPMSITPHGANKINQRSTGHCSRAGSNMTHLMVRYSEIEKKNIFGRVAGYEQNRWWKECKQTFDILPTMVYSPILAGITNFLGCIILKHHMPYVHGSTIQNFRFTQPARFLPRSDMIW